jgi:hypothetical protein
MTLPAVRDLVRPVCEEHGITVTALFHPKRRSSVEARWHLFHLAQSLDPRPSNVEIAETIGVSEASVRRGAANWRRKMRLCACGCGRSVNALRSRHGRVFFSARCAHT